VTNWLSHEYSGLNPCCPSYSQPLVSQTKLRVWYAVRARIAQSAFFSETINCEGYVQAILVQLFPELTEEESFYGWFQQVSATAHIACMSMQASIPSGTEISALVFGRNIHPNLILLIFSSVVVCRTKFKH
jgi:hypothetical protein